MKVAVAQMKCKTYDKQKNFEIATKLIEEAVEKGAKIVVLPELFNTGYCSTEKDWELAEKSGEETEKFLQGLAEKYNCSIFGGFVEKSNVQGLVYNSLMMVSPKEETKIYRKMYLWGAEKNRFIAGNKLSVWRTNGMTVAPQICYEVGFSENAKISALNGAECLIYSSAFGVARYYTWDIATRARALETGCYVIASNHSDVEGDIEFCAHSRIVDPQGTVLCECEEENSVVVADIDLDFVYEQRNALPYLRDIQTKMISEEYAIVNR